VDVQQHPEPGNQGHPSSGKALLVVGLLVGEAPVSDAPMDPALSVQLTEAAHTLYRAAVALECVQSSGGMLVGVRCPFLAANHPFDPDDGPGGMFANPIPSDEALADIAKATDTLRQLELPALDPTGVLTADHQVIGTIDHHVASVHPAGSDQFLQELAARLNADVIHGVIEAGLALHRALQRTTDARAVKLVEEAIAILDETVHKPRSAVFDHDGLQG
jgi:hypothetical protein